MDELSPPPTPPGQLKLPRRVLEGRDRVGKEQPGLSAPSERTYTKSELKGIISPWIKGDEAALAMMFKVNILR